MMNIFIVNPRSLDRLNAACTVFLCLALAALTFLAIQSVSVTGPKGGTIDVRIKGIEQLMPAAATEITTQDPAIEAELS